MRRHHKQLERLRHLANLLVDQAEHVISVRHSRRYAHDLEQQFYCLLKFAIRVLERRLAQVLLDVRRQFGRHGLQACVPAHDGRLMASRKWRECQRPQLKALLFFMTFHMLPLLSRPLSCCGADDCCARQPHDTRRVRAPSVCPLSLTPHTHKAKPQAKPRTRRSSTKPLCPLNSPPSQSSSLARKTKHGAKKETQRTVHRSHTQKRPRPTPISLPGSSPPSLVHLRLIIIIFVIIFPFPPSQVPPFPLPSSCDAVLFLA